MEIAEWAASQLEYVVTGAKKANQVAPGEEEDELDQKAKNIDFTKVVLAREKKEVEAKENLVVKVLKRFDGYGDSEEAYDPNEYPKVCYETQVLKYLPNVSSFHVDCLGRFYLYSLSHCFRGVNCLEYLQYRFLRTNRYSWCFHCLQCQPKFGSRIRSSDGYSYIRFENRERN
jgi:hypothetical protein